MRQTAVTFSLLLVSALSLAGSAFAQDGSVFRYASDPFSADAAEDASAKEATPDASVESAEEKPSYDSYASWPSEGKNLVQRKAIFRAQQREMRIAARQWYGDSASRPAVFGNPYYMDAYAPSLWAYTTPGPDLYGPFGWYFPRRSASSFRWTPRAYTAAAYLR